MLEDDAAVAEFCSLLPRLRARARQEGWDDVLVQTEAAVRAGEAAPAAALEELWSFLGLRGIQRSGRPLSLAPPGQEPLPPPAGEYRCPGPPGSRCARVVKRSPGEAVPECSLHQIPLRFGAP